MKDSQPLVPWMEHLFQLIPPSRVVMVGPGKGTGDWVAFLSGLDETPVTLIDADPVSSKFLQHLATSHPKWQIHNEVIARDSTTVSFYQTTVSSENSLIHPDHLRSIWPNLKSQQVLHLAAVTLDALLRQNRPAANWLLIDCLPALELIEGAGDSLDAVDVIAARIITSASAAELGSALLQPLQDSLEKRGFALRALEISRHPSLGHALFTRSKCFGNQKQISTRQKEPVDETSLAFYQNLAGQDTKTPPPPFLLIDSKSLPRSGLHYLKNTLARLLGDQFSFCEWYQEVGCCKRNPCALQGFAAHAQNTGRFRLRLIKSHDFEHTDPSVPTSAVLQRLVLVRDPLFTLTSWFELDELAKCQSLLKDQGIHIRKIWLLHEKEVLNSALEVLENHFVPPSPDEFKAWLLHKIQYMTQFIDDWVTPFISNADPHTRVICYEEIDRYVVDLITPYRANLSEDSIRAFDDFSLRHNDNFVKRSDPFFVKAKCVEAYIRDNAGLFEKAAAQIVSKGRCLPPASADRYSNPPSGASDDLPTPPP